MPTDDSGDASFNSLWIELDQPIKMLHKYVTELRELKRKKKEARAVLGSMRIHAVEGQDEHFEIVKVERIHPSTGEVLGGYYNE